MNLKSYQQWSWFLSTIVVVTLGMTSVEILRHQLGASAYEELTLLEIGSILGLSGVWVTLSGVCFVSLNRGLSVFLSISNPQHRLKAITRITLLIIGSIVVGYWFVLPLSLHHNLLALVCCIALASCAFWVSDSCTPFVNCGIFWRAQTRLPYTVFAFCGQLR